MTRCPNCGHIVGGIDPVLDPFKHGCWNCGWPHYNLERKPEVPPLLGYPLEGHEDTGFGD